MDQLLSIRRSDDIVFFEITRPNSANSLNHRLVDLMREAVSHLRRDGCRLLAFSGTGSSFCSGFDFSDVQHTTEGDLTALFLKIELFLQEIWHAPFATACFVQGAAYGAGADLVCACDFRIGGPAAHFRFPGPQFGLILGSRRLSERIGSDLAQNLLFSGRVVGAEEAVSIGLLNCLREVASIDEESERLAELLKADPGTIAAIRSLTRPDTTAEDMLALVRSALSSPLKIRIIEALGTRVK